MKVGIFKDYRVLKYRMHHNTLYVIEWQLGHLYL